MEVLELGPGRTRIDTTLLESSHQCLNLQQREGQLILFSHNSAILFPCALRSVPERVPATLRREPDQLLARL